VYIPFWISNTLFLITCGIAGYQHSRLNRENPVANLQFALIVFSMLMVVVIVLYSRHHENPWLSLAFFVIAVGTLSLTIRQHRMLPPNKSYE
jgi:hypothetical membrane protein